MVVCGVDCENNNNKSKDKTAGYFKTILINQLCATMPLKTLILSPLKEKLCKNIDAQIQVFKFINIFVALKFCDRLK